MSSPSAAGPAISVTLKRPEVPERHSSLRTIHRYTWAINHVPLLELAAGRSKRASPGPPLTQTSMEMASQASRRNSRTGARSNASPSRSPTPRTSLRHIPNFSRIISQATLDELSSVGPRVSSRPDSPHEVTKMSTHKPQLSTLSKFSIDSTPSTDSEPDLVPNPTVEDVKQEVDELKMLVEKELAAIPKSTGWKFSDTLNAPFAPSYLPGTNSSRPDSFTCPNELIKSSVIRLDQKHDLERRKTNDLSKTTSVKRWDGQSRTYSEWDGLRKDPELWFSDGDCLIHLYARGQSRRGPSFSVPIAALRAAKCTKLFSLCYSQICSDFDYMGKTELFVPSFQEASRDKAFLWHLTTRNFFAFVFGKPLVGKRLGKSLVDLQERLQMFRSRGFNNHDELHIYMEAMGYLGFVDCPDYALAVLYYAEHYKLQNLWTEAFAHCVGMNEILKFSDEYECISKTTKALIKRAYSEMSVNIGRVSQALRCFLEQDLSPTQLGLSPGARSHLDRFRAFLHGFYAEKFRYWPPPKGSSFSKSLLQSLCFDFRNLYDFLVDNESSNSIQDQKPATGGICVLQILQAFDKRHKHLPLAHLLPLVPDSPFDSQKRDSQRTLMAFKLGNKISREQRYISTRSALANATNSNEATITGSPIVRAYSRFEREWSYTQDEKVSVSDARRVRWILIYCTLQLLISITRAPPEVRQSRQAKYHLCCLTAGTPPWKKELLPSRDGSVPPRPTPLTLQASATHIPSSPAEALVSPRFSIRPDCEPDECNTPINKSNRLTIRPSADQRSPSTPTPRRVSSSTHGSIESLPQRLDLHNRSEPLCKDYLRSVKGRSSQFSPFISQRGTITQLPPQPLCDIFVYSYGNGLNNMTTEHPRPASDSSVTPSTSGQQDGLCKYQEFRSEESEPRLQKRRPVTIQVLKCDAIPDFERTPTLDSFHLDPRLIDEIPRSPDSTKASSTGPLTPVWSSGASSNSSATSQTKSSLSEGRSRSRSPDTICERKGSAVLTRRNSTGSIAPSSRASSVINHDIFADSIEKVRSEDKQGILVRRSFSIESFKLEKAEVDIYSAMAMLPQIAGFQNDGPSEEQLQTIQELCAPAPQVRRKSDRVEQLEINFSSFFLDDDDASVPPPIARKKAY